MTRLLYPVLCLVTMILVTGPSFASGRQHPDIPQQISWLYANSLSHGATFLSDTLGLTEVSHLIQGDICRIFSTGGGRFLGVCNSREPPACSGDPERSDNPGKTTYTFVVSTPTDVDTWHNYLAPHNGTTLRLTQPNASPTFGAYAFNFYDTNADKGLGCYRFEVQAFTDPAWQKTPHCEVDGTSDTEINATNILPIR